MSDPRFNTGDPIMDAALAADDAKLEAMGVYDEPTNPPVPATPLDVEACVRLLNDLILMLAPHDAQSIADADQLRALKAALPAMGKDSERLAFYLANPDLVSQYRGQWAWTQRISLPEDANAPAVPDVNGHLHDRFIDAESWHAAVDAAMEAYAAARAAQPEETSDA